MATPLETPPVAVSSFHSTLSLGSTLLRSLFGLGDTSASASSLSPPSSSSTSSSLPALPTSSSSWSPSQALRKRKSSVIDEIQRRWGDSGEGKSAAEQEEAENGFFVINISKCISLPPCSYGIRQTRFYILVEKKGKKGVEGSDGTDTLVCKTEAGEQILRHNAILVEWHQDLVVEYDQKRVRTVEELMEMELKFSLYVDHRAPLSHSLLGSTVYKVGDLLKRKERNLLLELPDGNILLNAPDGNPTRLVISANRNSFPEGIPALEAKPDYNPKNYAKHAMIITRGTRGDIQPFLALAVALSEHLGWLVTLCSETRYAAWIKGYIKSRRKAQDPANQRGMIRFRPSGGDTMLRVDSILGRWALRNGSDILQAIMMGKQEQEFFASEPILYYWANKLRPDVLLFGFTMANVAMILSEALRIPVIGFILQPTCIPSGRYPPLLSLYGSEVPTDEVLHGIRDPASDVSREPSQSIDQSTIVSSVSMGTVSSARRKPSLIGSHEAHLKMSRVKTFFENNPLWQDLNHLRRRRGLGPIHYWRSADGILSRKISVPTFASKTWSDIVAQNVPIVVPINPIAFGGKPQDWNEVTTLTDFIFLPTVGSSKLSSRITAFAEKARSDGVPIVVMGFSSMPVPQKRMLDFGELITDKCKRKPRVIMLVGDKSAGRSVASAERFEERIRSIESHGNILIESGAPFQLLFPLVDCAVIHGGLGTTADALKAGIPVIVTGVLLMDQRFWGARVHNLEVGPPPVHHSEFHDVCCKYVDYALTPNNAWLLNAKALAKELKPESDVDGLLTNAKAIEKMMETVRPYSYKGRTLHSLKAKHTSTDP